MFNKFARFIDKFFEEIKYMITLIVFFNISMAVLLFIYWLVFSAKLTLPYWLELFVWNMIDFWAQGIKDTPMYQEITPILPVLISGVFVILTYFLNCLIVFLESNHEKFNKKVDDYKQHLAKKINEELHHDFINELKKNNYMLLKIKIVAIRHTSYLSEYTDEQDVNTKVLLGDGAGATLIGKSNDNKKYFQNIISEGQRGEILTCKQDEKIFMDGKNVYKFGTTEPVKCVNELLEKANEKIENIKYIIPHQSNLKMMKSMSEKLNIDLSKMYINIENVGNTFNASIPLALNELINNNLIQRNDKIILLGYGGGLNLGAIYIEY